MTNLVHEDQTGFIKSCSTSDNLSRLLCIIYSAEQSDYPSGVLSLDDMKAFDCLEFNYLWSVLEHMRLGSGFIDMMKVLYTLSQGQLF